MGTASPLERSLSAGRHLAANYVEGTLARLGDSHAEVLAHDSKNHKEKAKQQGHQACKRPKAREWHAKGEGLDYQDDERDERGRPEDEADERKCTQKLK